MLNLTKGMKIRVTRTNSAEEFKDTTANSVLEYEVTRVNKKTYSLVCTKGYMQGTGCKLLKDFPEASKDVYGTEIRREII